jgi:hypothetical protein
MRRLAAWSGHLVLGLWLAWFGLLVGRVALSVRRQWQSQVRAPEQHTDLIYSVRSDEVGLLKTGLVLFGPPGLLTVLWLYARHRRQPEGPT